MTEELLQAITTSTFFFTLFSLFLILVKLIDRMRRIQMVGQKIPSAFWRDLIFWSGLGVILVVPVANTMINGDNLLRAPWWIITRSALTVTVILVQLYFEFFVIDKEH